jgi:hypothetical protein
LGDDVTNYAGLLAMGQVRMETELFDGEYFNQKVEWENLRAKNPLEVRNDYPPEEVARLEREGPKYQYGKGCLADGVLGAWLAMVCGVGPVAAEWKITSHLRAVYKYNLKADLTDHPNPQRPGYACCCFAPGRKVEIFHCHLFTQTKCGRASNTRSRRI